MVYLNPVVFCKKILFLGLFFGVKTPANPWFDFRMDAGFFI